MEDSLIASAISPGPSGFDVRIASEIAQNSGEHCSKSPGGENYAKIHIQDDLNHDPKETTPQKETKRS